MLSSCKTKVPCLAKRGVNRVTSFRYVQIIPSPRVGSGVDVRQTAKTHSSNEYHRRVTWERTFDIIQCEDTKPIVLRSNSNNSYLLSGKQGMIALPIRCNCEVQANSSPRSNRATIGRWTARKFEWSLTNEFECSWRLTHIERLRDWQCISRGCKYDNSHYSIYLP